VETGDPIERFDAKEAGEGTQLSPAPAIVDTIYEAIEVDFIKLPTTAGKVFEALEKNLKGKANIFRLLGKESTWQMPSF